ncbi:MAG: UvrD-helicase domain-containing protein [Gaiellaceae bacterium]
MPVASPEQYLASLNPAQREAVLHTEGPLLVIAGAGSGKTRVLTHRVAHLISAVGVKPNEILAITFTNKAAGEMRERLTTMLGPVARAIWILTFHAACGRILRSEAERLGYRSNFTIYDSADQVRVVKQCLEELEKDPKRFVPRGVHAQISNAKNQLVTPALYAERISSFYDQTVAEVYALYQRKLAASNAVDFDDMLMLTVQILESFPDARKHWQNAFRYVLVDEYQDTNHAQYRLLQLLAEKHHNICAVGDPDQCLVAGTLVTMADGTTKPIEEVRVGDEVLSGLGSGRFGPATVSRVHEGRARTGIEIVTASGRRVVSTPEHVHFAGVDAASPTTAGGLAVAVRADTDRVARLGVDSRELPFTSALDVDPGMVMLDDDGEYDVVESVEWTTLDRPVYDLNVERTHNFVANGLLTHNSIYAFRGADIRNILEFERDFPETRTIPLEQNYRSTNAILEAANAVIANNSERKEKRLWSELGDGDPVRVVEVEDEQSEARYVAAQIAGLVEEGFNGSEIAIFYRMNAQSRVLEQTLRLHQIGYQVIGGPRFYERAEVKDATAYLQVLDNPADAVSLLRIANRPKRGIGDTTISRLVSYAENHGLTLYDALGRPTEAGLGTAAVKAVTGLKNMLDSLRAAAQEEGVPELLQTVLERSGTLEAYEAERTIEARGRIENLEAFVDGARQYTEETEEPTLSGFLQEISLYSDQDALGEEQSNVTLMTIHNAKGLEFRAVFVVGVEEEIFPSARSIEEQGVEEERRLFYVGLTRAQERLTLTHASSRLLWGRTTSHLPSRFLDELPDRRVERERLRPSSWRSYGSPQQTREIAPRAGHPALSTGDSVRHGTLGEGVITRIEPGGVVTVRFANDGSERKLMLDYAPLEKLA